MNDVFTPFPYRIPSVSAGRVPDGDWRGTSTKRDAGVKTRIAQLFHCAKGPSRFIFQLVVKTKIPVSPAEVASAAKSRIRFKTRLILALWLVGTLATMLAVLVVVGRWIGWPLIVVLSMLDEKFAGGIVGWWPWIALTCVTVVQLAMWPSLVRLVSGSGLSTPLVSSLASGLMLSCLVVSGGVGLLVLVPDEMAALGLVGTVVFGVLVLALWTNGWLRKSHDLDPLEVILRQNSLLLKLGLLWLLLVSTACFLLREGWLIAWVTVCSTLGTILSALLPKALLLLTGQCKEPTANRPAPWLSLNLLKKITIRLRKLRRPD